MLAATCVDCSQCHWSGCCLLNALLLLAPWFSAGLAIPHHSLPLQILHGPISLAVGTAAGAAAGMLTSMPLVWASSNVRMLAGVMFSELLIFCG